MEYNLGQRMGLTGTPMILTADGTQVGGYVPPEQLRAALDKLAGKPVQPAVAAPSMVDPGWSIRSRRPPAVRSDSPAGMPGAGHAR